MANRPISEVEKFEAFKKELRAVPDAEVIAGIESGLDSAAISLRNSIIERPINRGRLVAATYQFGLLALAKSGLVEGEGEAIAPWQTPRWILTARDDLMSRAEDPLGESDPLRAAVFFAEDQAFLRTLNASVNASVEPAGDYDAKSFAAGVVRGKIVSSHAQVSPTS